MITSYQIQAARALLGIDQRTLSELAGISLPTIQRIESSIHPVRGAVDTLVKLTATLEGAGIEFLGENGSSVGIGRGVRLQESAPTPGRTRRLSLKFDRPGGVVTGEDAR